MLMTQLYLTDTPFRIGPFHVDPQGVLSPCDPAEMPGFSVGWRGNRVHARVAPEGALQLRALLGRVPSTAQSAGLRDPVLSALRHLPRLLPEGWRIGIMPDHLVCLEAESGPIQPITATTLLSGLTAFLLRLSPYLDLLDDVGVTSVRPAGSVNT